MTHSLAQLRQIERPDTFFVCCFGPTYSDHMPTAQAKIFRRPPPQWPGTQALSITSCQASGPNKDRQVFEVAHPKHPVRLIAGPGYIEFHLTLLRAQVAPRTAGKPQMKHTIERTPVIVRLMCLPTTLRRKHRYDPLPFCVRQILTILGW